MNKKDLLFISKESWRKTDDGSRKGLVERGIVHLVSFNRRTSILVPKGNLSMARRYLGKNPFANVQLAA